MRSSLLSCSCLVLVAAAIPGPSLATTISTLGPFEFLDNRSSNDAGVQAGVVIQFGENNVVPNGQAQPPTTATATSPGGTVVNLPNLNEGVNSNLFTTSVADTTTNRGSWTLNFSNGTNTATASTPSIPTSLLALPFVTNVSVSGTGLDPTISWNNTATSSVLDAIAIRIRDNGVTASLNGHYNASVVSLNYFAPATTSVNVSQLALGQLTAGHEYSIEIDQVTLRNGTFNPINSTGSDFVNTLNQSRAFFDYSASATSTGSQSVFLPTVGTQPNGLPAYTFSVQNVAANTPVFIDPQIAIGYSYKIGLGDPNFASVTLPTLNGTGSYTIVLSDGETFTVLPGQKFDFTQLMGFGNGVSSFKVLGINPNSGLNPDDPLAFVTQLTFAGDGEFTGEMDPITAAVPEPSTWAMMILGFLGVGFMAYRKKSTLSLA